MNMTLNIKHVVLISQSNGLAEACVKPCKMIFKKAKADKKFYQFTGMKGNIHN
jgi:hypothetical protein